MPFLSEPSVSIEDVKIQAVSLSRLRLDVIIRVENPNIFDIRVEKLPFQVLCRTGDGEIEIASGEVKEVSIARKSDTVVSVPVVTDNAGCLRAITTLLKEGLVPVTVNGVATIDCLVTSWSFPFTKTITVTPEQILGAR
jgi:LEA14-like dessication related protein